jgi:hypothetical protein
MGTLTKYQFLLTFFRTLISQRCYTINVFSDLISMNHIIFRPNFCSSRDTNFRREVKTFFLVEEECFDINKSIYVFKTGEPDPDPSPYLVVSMEMKREDMLKPYDSKKSVWVSLVFLEQNLC